MKIETVNKFLAKMAKVTLETRTIKAPAMPDGEPRRVIKELLYSPKDLWGEKRNYVGFYIWNPTENLELAVAVAERLLRLGHLTTWQISNAKSAVSVGAVFVTEAIRPSEGLPNLAHSLSFAIYRALRANKK